MAAIEQPKSAEELGLTIDGINHMTLPVRDHDRARKFYVELLGGEVTREPSWASTGTSWIAGSSSTYRR